MAGARHLRAGHARAGADRLKRKWQGAETIADCAYGDGSTRQAFPDAGRTLVAKVPIATNQGRFPKTDFVLDNIDGVALGLASRC